MGTELTRAANASTATNSTNSLRRLLLPPHSITLTVQPTRPRRHEHHDNDTDNDDTTCTPLSIRRAHVNCQRANHTLFSTLLRTTMMQADNLTTNIPRPDPPHQSRSA